MLSSRWMGRRGEGKVGCIIGAIILLIFVYIAFKFIPVKVAFAEVRDVATKSAEMASIKTDDVIRGDIMRTILENKESIVPIKPTDITVYRADSSCTVKFELHKTIDLIGGKTYEWRETFDIRRTMF